MITDRLQSPASTSYRTVSPERMSVSTNEASSDFFPLQSSDNYAGESLVPGDTGSTGSLDHITEDVNTISVNKPSGYLGKTNEATWMNRVSEELEKADNETRAEDFGLSPSQKVTNATSRAAGMNSSRRIVQGMLTSDNFKANNLS